MPEITRRSFYHPNQDPDPQAFGDSSVPLLPPGTNPDNLPATRDEFDLAPTTAIPPPELAFYQEKNFLGPVCAAIAGAPTLLGGLIALSMGSLDPFLITFLLFFVVCLSLGSVPIALSLWGSVYPSGKTRRFSYRMPLKNAWFDISRLRGRRGLMVHVSFLAHGFVGKHIEVFCRFRGPDGHYLRSRLRNYRGSYGELRTRHRTDPVKNGVAAFRNLWMFVPLRAMAIPRGSQEVRLEAEILLTCEDVVHTEHDLDIYFRPLPEDFPEALVTSSSQGVTFLDGDPDPGADEIEILETKQAENIICGLCGDPLSHAPTKTCSLCKTSLHHECWDYNQGCVTYACEGRPQEPSAS